MNNLLSYCGLVDERISASEKDLPVKLWNYLAYSNKLRIRNFKKIVPIFAFFEET